MSPHADHDHSQCTHDHDHDHHHVHAPLQPFVRDAKVGRNDPCPCGSGQKFKKCCQDRVQA